MSIITGHNKETDQSIYFKISKFVKGIVRAQSEARRLFIVDTSLDIDTKNIYWDEIDEQAGFNYTHDFEEVPEAKYTTKTKPLVTPVLVGAMKFSKDLWRRIQKSGFGFEARASQYALKLVEAEDIYTLMGKADIGVSSYIGDANVTTIAAGTLNMGTSIANIHATIANFFDNIDDNYEFNSANLPVIGTVSRSNWKTMRAVLDVTIEFKNGLEYGKALWQEFGGPGSELRVSKYMGGSAVFAVSTKKPTVTPGTNIMTASIMSNEVALLLDSPLLRDDDPETVQFGKYIRWAERIRLNTRDTKGLYQATLAG